MSDVSKKGGHMVLILAVICTLAWLVVACSETNENPTQGDTGASTTSTTGSATQVTGPNGSERIVVGGKTTEEYAAALPELEKAVAADPTNLAALQELALAQYNTQKYEEAAATYQKMLQIKDEAFTRNNYGNVLRDWGKLDAARGEYEKAISTDATLTVAYFNLISVYVAETKIDEALKVIDRGLAALTGDDKKRLQDFKQQLLTATTTT